MQEIAKQVSRARRRLFIERLLRLTGWSLLGGLSLALLGVVLSRFMPVAVEPWMWLLGGLAVGLLAGAIAALATGPSRLAAAIELDHRCRLKERVSTVLSLGPDDLDSPPGQAVLTDAERRVSGVDVAAEFPLRPSRSLLWPLLPAGLAVAVAMLFPPAAVPPAVATPGNQDGQRIERQVEVLRRELARQRQEAQRRGLKELDQLLKKVERGTAEVRQAKLDRPEALKKLNNLSDQLRDQREQLAGKEQLRRKLAQLEKTKPGPAKPLGDALRDDELDRAMRELEKLAEQLENSELSKEEREQLSQQMEQMRQQLEQMAQSQREAIERLEQQCEQCRSAGQQTQADALQRQLDQLRQGMPSMELTEEMCQQLSACRDSLGQGDKEGAAQALRNLRGQLEGLEDAEAARQMLADAERRLSECRGGMCGREREADEQQVGQGGLKPGTAPGSFVQDPTDPQGEFFDTHVRPKITAGEMSVVGTADGPNRRGRVAEEVQVQVEEAELGETDPLAGRRLPRHLRDATREYFNDLRQDR